jgi:hypothetical protein
MLIPAPRTVPVLLGFVFCACLALLGCRRPVENDPGLILTHQISPAPPKVGPATVALTLADKAGAPLRGAKVVLEGNMSHPGMAPVLSDAHETEAGQYRGPIDFKMSGDWVITVRITLPDGRAVAREFKVTGVRPE